MFPSKSMVGETSRFFPMIQMDGDTSNIYTSPFHTPVANRYSSSTDSTSPESYFNTPFPITQPSEHNKPSFETQRTYERRLYDYSSPASYNTPEYPIESPTYKLNRPSFETPRTYESKLYDYISPVTHNTPEYGFESPTSKLNRPPTNYTAFDRNVTGFERQYDNTNTFDTNFQLFEPVNTDPSQFGDTPFQLRQQRARVGRKILGCHSRASIDEMFKPESNLEYNIWQPTTSHVPESTQMHYELFPSNEKSYEFHTPKKSEDFRTSYARTLSPSSSVVSSSFLQNSPNRIHYENLSPLSGRIDNASPTSNWSQSVATSNRTLNLSPNNSNRACYPENISPNKIPNPLFKLHNLSLNSGAVSTKNAINQSKICMFCRKNGEAPNVYMTHCVKEKIGNVYRVTCPILRALVCMTCGASGDNAHTITYCPVLRNNNDGKPLPSTTITLKNTRVKSNGRKRY